jgi:predicted HAD superfamily phosphohydrolase
MNSIQLDTDCEGPLCLNDNAFELCRDFIRPDGDRFFKQVSRYDDYLADILKKTGYKAGDTLKLILPFLRAYGLTNAALLEYSLKSILLVPGVADTYQFLLSRQFPIFEISTSYRQFALAVGLKLGLNESNIFCTELNLDRYQLSTLEIKTLQALKTDIAALPEIELPPQAQSLNDLEAPVQAAIGRMDQIFWEIIPDLAIGSIYQEVNPIGGFEKARALEESLTRTGLPMAAAIYVGDSITDVQAFQAVQAGGGLGVSFNGNRYSVNSAELIVIADTAWPVALIAALFITQGKEAVLALAQDGLPADLAVLKLPREWTQTIAQGLKGRQVAFQSAAPSPSEAIIQASAAMRSRLRGAAIAALG